jgi:hypothetical protein
VTTIATSSGVVAADSQVTGNFKFPWSGKVRRVESGPYAGWIFCAAGRLDFVPVAYAQVLSGEFSPLCGTDDDDGGCYLLVGKSKVTCLEADKMIPYPVSKTFAIGSGCKYAMAAMACGKTPAEAVKIAAKFDSFTGGAVRVLAV